MASIPPPRPEVSLARLMPQPKVEGEPPRLRQGFVEARQECRASPSIKTNISVSTLASLADCSSMVEAVTKPE